MLASMLLLVVVVDCAAVYNESVNSTVSTSTLRTTTSNSSAAPALPNISTTKQPTEAARCLLSAAGPGPNGDRGVSATELAAYSCHSEWTYTSHVVGKCGWLPLRVLSRAPQNGSACSAACEQHD